MVADAASTPGHYYRVERIWAAGDVVEVDIPMPVRLLESHPLVEETRNQVAVMRGPLVYCLESTDLPEGVRPVDILLPRTIHFKAVQDGASLRGPLAGVTALAGRAFTRDGADSWTGQLYRAVAQGSISEIPIQLIPYYAWDNRGKSEMTVWMSLVT